MIYFSTKQDLEFISEFQEYFRKMRFYEQKARKSIRKKKDRYISFYGFWKAVRDHAIRYYPEYKEIRTKYTRMTTRAIKITENQSVIHQITIAPGLLEGSPNTYSGTIYRATLEPVSGLYDYDSKFDVVINQVIGSLEHQAKSEFWQLINPIYWTKEFIKFMLKLPFTILEHTGFDMDILQRYMIDRLIAIVYYLFWIYLLGRLGINIVDAISLNIK